MSGFASYLVGVGLTIAIAVAWVGVQRLWLRWSGGAGTGRDALAGRMSCAGDGGCGACDGPCERAGRSPREVKEDRR